MLVSLQAVHLAIQTAWVENVCCTGDDHGLFSSLLHPEYKKKYGEEHGSCQAGIAGFFTEVSRDECMEGMGLVSSSPAA